MCADGLALHMRAAKTRRALVVAKDGFANFDFGRILFSTFLLTIVLGKLNKN